MEQVSNPHEELLAEVEKSAEALKNKEMSVPVTDPNRLVAYVAPTAPNLNIKLFVNDVWEYFQFQNGQLELPLYLAVIFDETIRQSSGLQPLVRKVDLAAARQMVAAIEKERGPTAFKGSQTSSHAAQLESLRNLDLRLKAQGADNQAMLDELSGGKMALQEVVEQPVDKASLFRFNPPTAPPEPALEIEKNPLVDNVEKEE